MLCHLGWGPQMQLSPQSRRKIIGIGSVGNGGARTTAVDAGYRFP